MPVHLGLLTAMFRIESIFLHGQGLVPSLGKALQHPAFLHSVVHLKAICQDLDPQVCRNVLTHKNN